MVYLRTVGDGGVAKRAGTASLAGSALSARAGDSGVV